MSQANHGHQTDLLAFPSTKHFLADQTVPLPTVATSVRRTTLLSFAHPGPLSSVPTNFFPISLFVHTPVKVWVLNKFLLSHPNRDLVDFIISGFTYGFRLGCSQNTPLTSATRNNKSAYTYENLVDEAILKELNRGHTVGPFDFKPLDNLHCSPLGAAPKKDGTVRVVLDLSSPRGFSVNDRISKEDFSVQYSSFDEAVNLIKSLGPNCYMAKLDIKHAFRLCPVHADDWHLLGYLWKNRYYFDVVLPFGGRSSPFIFNNFADLLTWILIVIILVTNLKHYLDDFITAHCTKSQCQYVVDAIIHTFSLIGVPLAEDKIIGPVQVITYLGIEIDTINLVLRLPHQKFCNLMSELREWNGRKKCKKRDLLSLIGSLSFACKVVKSGRIFLRRLIDLSTTVDRLHHHIDISAEARKDIEWWLEFLPPWNGVALFHTNTILSSKVDLSTDASGVGLGGYYNGQWFSLPFQSKRTYSISFLELLAIVIATFCWGEGWTDNEVVLGTDNEAIVQIWHTGSCKCKDIMTLIRHLFFFTAQRNINLLLCHVPGHSNIYADLLSRLQVSKFKKECTKADRCPTAIPSSVWNLLKSL